MPASTDPALLLFYSLDESGPTATRANLGFLGSAQDLTPAQNSGTDGIPAVADGNGGKAVDLLRVRSGWTSTARYLRAPTALGSAHTCRPAFPIASANDDFAFGCRFQWAAGNTTGGALEWEHLFGLADQVAPLINGWGIGVTPNSASAPTLAKLRLVMPNGSQDVDTGAFTSTGSPATFYLSPNEWYRVTVRIFFSATGYKAKLYILRESTGDLYTWTLNSPAITNYTGAFLASTDVRVWASLKDTAGAVWGLFGGYLDECWLYDAPLTDTEATSIVTGGFSVPWTPPSYRVADHDVYAAVTNEGSDYPVTRPMPTGALACRFPPDRRVNRARVRVEGWRPGRPWLLRCVEGIFDTAGPFTSKAGNRFRLDDVNRALMRAGGEVPAGTWEDARGVETTVNGPRRRRGFQIRRSVATDQGDNNSNAFYFFRANDGSLYGVYKVGTKLYEETGSGASVLDTGWSAGQLPSFLFLDNRAIILSGARRKSWRGTSGTISSFGIAAPGSISALAAAGGSLSGTYYYAATFYDPVTGDESAPVVLTNPVSPAVQKVTLTLPASSGDARFTQYRIYRTTNGGSAPNLFLIETVTIAAAVDDTGQVDGTILVGQVTDTSGTLLAYITGSPPDTFSFGCVHKERAFYSGGATAPERIYVSEANDPMRWYTSDYLVCESAVKCLLSWGDRLVAFTDSTVEIFESDWIRDADGNRNVQRFVVSRNVGCVGHAAACVVGDSDAYWKDRRGVWTFAGTKPVPLSRSIADLFPYENHAISSKSVLSYNHVRESLWCSIAHSTLQPESDRFQTVLALDLKALSGGAEKWTIHRQAATYHRSFDDDLNGLKFGMIDALGVFKIGETYEGDGAQGNESYTTEDEGGASGSVGISTIVGSVITVFGTPGWTTDALRGMGVILRDRSTGLLYWHLIARNDTTSFTVVGTPNAALAARDGYYIGGILSYVQFAEQALATPNEKVIRQVHLEFADLTRTDLYL